MSFNHPFVVTPGDPAGIGAEITIKSWLAGCKDICLIESPDRIAKISADLNTPIAIKTITHPNQFTIENEVLQII